MSVKPICVCRRDNPTNTWMHCHVRIKIGKKWGLRTPPTSNWSCLSVHADKYGERRVGVVQMPELLLAS